MTVDPAPRGVPEFVGEFLGTLLLVLFIGMTFTLNSAGGLGVLDVAVLGLVHLLALAVLLEVFRGAHLNPAVTVAFAALRRIGPVDALTSVVLQLAGGVAGALLVELLVKDEGAAARYGAPLITDGRFLDGSLLGGFAVELIGVFVLTLAYLTDRRAWVAGAVLGLLVMTLSPLSGGAFNPARALGPSLAAEGEPVVRFLVAYVLGPLVGALLAAALAPLLRHRPSAATGTGAPAVTAGPERPAATAGAVAAEPVHRPVDRLE